MKVFYLEITNGEYAGHLAIANPEPVHYSGMFRAYVYYVRVFANDDEGGAIAETYIPEYWNKWLAIE